MDDLYRDYILEHYKRPKNFGELEPHDLSAHDHNPLCGDEMGVHIRVEDGKIADLRFHGQGCAISQATASIISDELKGKTVAEVAGLDRSFIAEEIGIELSPTRLKCGLLSLKVVQGALLGTDEWPSGTPDEDPDVADVARLRNETFFTLVAQCGIVTHGLEERTKPTICGCGIASDRRRRVAGAMRLIRFVGRVNCVDPVSSCFVEESRQALGGVGISSRRARMDAGERPSRSRRRHAGG